MLRYILYADFLVAFGGGLWLMFHNKSLKTTKLLGLFIFLFALNILHIINVHILHQTSFNPLILLPLNLIFFSVHTIVRYLEAIFQKKFLHTYFTTFLLLISVLEVSANFLPFGAWIYTGEFDSKMIRFVFSIKRVFLALLLPVGVYVIGKLIFLYRELQLQQQFLLISWIKKLTILFSALLILVLLPEFALLMEQRNFFLFILQSTGGVVILAYVVYCHHIFSTKMLASSMLAENVESNKYYEIILQLFNNEKIYRNQQLRIADIAERVELSPNYVSTIINENASVGFNELVNQYRIIEVIEKFRNNEHQIKSIAALAEEAGFGSKSTFQAAFKKQTGKTPTEFLQTLPTKNNQDKNIP